MLTYGLANADVAATGIVTVGTAATGRGISLSVATPWGRGELQTKLVGTFNASNVLGCLGALLASDIPLSDALAALAEVEPPPGRMQRLGGVDAPLVIVDYAHSPDALEKVLNALRPAVAEDRELVCVFGCGGDRDAGKRPEMGRVAATLADRVIVTTDNPRSEDPAAIASAIVHGVRDSGNRRWSVDLDRATAINAADFWREGGRRRARRRQGPRGLPGSERRAHAVLGRGGGGGRACPPGRRMMDTATAARAVAGRAVGANVHFARVSTDTRVLAPGDLFVALAGERFDGHDFVGDAFQRGAAAALVAADRAATLAGPLIAVPDTQAALLALAAHWRARFAIPVVVVVGSNGKTTVKEMLAAILRAHYGAGHVLATEGNLNNAIGLPLTLLALNEAHRAAVIELGMNHRGETAELAAIAQPTVALVNNAQREHQEFMRTVGEVAAEHAELIRALPPGGIAVINADDPHVEVWRDAARGRPGVSVIEFALEQKAAVRGRWTAGAPGSPLVLSTPAGDVTVDARRAGTAQRCECARRRDRRRSRSASRWPPWRAGSRRSARCRDGSRHCARNAAPRSSTTRTTRIRIPCAPPSTSSAPCLRRDGSCWATWARSARRARHTTARLARERARRGSTGCSRRARSPRRRPRPSAPARRISRRSRRWPRTSRPRPAPA